MLNQDDEYRGQILDEQGKRQGFVPFVGIEKDRSSFRGCRGRWRLGGIFETLEQLQGTRVLCQSVFFSVPPEHSVARRTLEFTFRRTIHLKEVALARDKGIVHTPVNRTQHIKFEELLEQT